MSKKRIVFQGEPGANSHLAISQAYPDAEAVPCATFEDAFTALSAGDADLGMIPIENSVAGRVADIHHLMPSSGLHIIGEHFMPVHHQLLAVKGATLKTVKTSSTGELKTTTKATVDGYYRYSFAGTSTTPAVKATGDYVDVK